MPSVTETHKTTATRPEDGPLPPTARAKLIALQGAAADARDAASSAAARLGDLSKALSYADTPPPNASDLEVEMTRLTKVREQQGRRHSELAALCATIAHWAQTLSPNVRFDLAKPIIAKPLGSETLLVAIMRTRDELDAAQQHLRAVKTAPLPKADLKKAARNYVEQLAQRGRPRVSGLGGGLKVDFSDPQAYTGATPDSVAAMLAWFAGDAFTFRLQTEIDAMPEGKLSLSAQGKEKRITELSADLDKLERAEESLIEQATLQGIDVLRRPMASPLAVLGITLAPKVARVKAA